MRLCLAVTKCRRRALNLILLVPCGGEGRGMCMDGVECACTNIPSRQVYSAIHTPQEVNAPLQVSKSPLENAIFLVGPRTVRWANWS